MSDGYRDGRVLLSRFGSMAHARNWANLLVKENQLHPSEVRISRVDTEELFVRGGRVFSATDLCNRLNI